MREREGLEEGGGRAGGEGGSGGGKHRKNSRPQLKKQASTELQAAYQKVGGATGAVVRQLEFEMISFLPGDQNPQP